MNKYDLFVKVGRAIDSCTTKDQLWMAKKYKRLFLDKFPDMQEFEYLLRDKIYWKEKDLE